ncbi:MAG TPA: hypothetical protein VEJ86_07075 [Candidatus Binataceae bacterium]|nr:hypothetical protein [Candidatus Binataceae bacterium]
MRLNNLTGRIVVLGAMAVLAVAARASAQDADQTKPMSKPPTMMASVREQAPIPAGKIPNYVKTAVNAPDRPSDDKKLDAGRKPEQMLAFYDVKPGDTVADLWAGGGWTTELLSRTVNIAGKVYSLNPPFPPRFKKVEDQWKARANEPALKNVTEVQVPWDGSQPLIPAPPGSLDLVIMNMNYHDMVWLKLNRAAVNEAVFKALKPGGIYAIIDNSAKPGSGDVAAGTLHRIDEQWEIADIEKAGFKLEAASSALRNPKDDRSEVVFKHRGEQDRFMLKFVKPMQVAS